MAEDHPRQPTGRTPAHSSGLGTRIVSGVVLAVGAFGLLYAGVYPFAALLLAVALTVSWEWSHMVRTSDDRLTLIVHTVTVAGAFALAVVQNYSAALAVLAIGAIATALASFTNRPMLSAAGVAYAGLPAIALYWFRSDPQMGLLAALFVIGAVAVTDTAAYAAGRTIGGPKLAPVISPKKNLGGISGRHHRRWPSRSPSCPGQPIACWLFDGTWGSVGVGLTGG
jgi:phosphatidate cytidylyltransferase